jgi:hypothetical protein
VRVWKELCQKHKHSEEVKKEKKKLKKKKLWIGIAFPNKSFCPFAGQTPPLQSPPPPRDACSEGRGRGGRRWGKSGVVGPKG